MRNHEDIEGTALELEQLVSFVKVEKIVVAF